MCSQLNVGFGVEPFHSRALDRAVHPLDLPVRPGVVGLGQAVLDPVGLTDHVEAHWSGIDCVAVPGLPGELNAVVGENGVDLAGRGFEQVLKELQSSLSISRFNELGDREPGCPVDADEEV